MAEPFVGQIILFGGSFAIRGWAFCNGQLLSVSQNDALFSLLGTAYGGDGRTTFGLPDLRGRIPIHQGRGPGLSPRNLGSKVGVEDVTLQPNELAPHNHVLNAWNSGAVNPGPDDQLTADPNANNPIYGEGTPPDTLDASAIGDSGGGGQHPNVMPFQCVSFLIALRGIYPPRT